MYCYHFTSALVSGNPSLHGAFYIVQLGKQTIYKTNNKLAGRHMAVSAEEENKGRDRRGNQREEGVVGGAREEGGVSQKPGVTSPLPLPVMIFHPDLRTDNKESG